MNNLKEYNKNRDFIVCIDSDGCAMDTMNIKHIRCFGPCLVKEWGLEAWKEPVLERWNEINLFSGTRGINRFKGLALMLEEADSKYCRIQGIDKLSDWAVNAPELSNAALENMTDDDEIFRKALSWSRAVNNSIKELPLQEIKPFEGVTKAFELIHKSFDIAVVSSANPEAVRQEWERFALLDKVDVLCTQDAGSKAFCLEEICKKGYDVDKILMCGDAPGDKIAAEKSGVLFYPILVGHEEASWEKLSFEALGIFERGEYRGAYQQMLDKCFDDNLAGKK